MLRLPSAPVSSRPACNTRAARHYVSLTAALLCAGVVAAACHATSAPDAAPRAPLCPAWAPDVAETQALTSPERQAAAAAAASPTIDAHDAVFGELSRSELDAVHAFLTAHRGLGLVDTGTPSWRARLGSAFGALDEAWGASAGGGAHAAALAPALASAAEVMATSHVHAIWREAPPKDEAVAYLDSDRAGRPPRRKARAMLVLAGSARPRVQEVVVTIDPPPPGGAGGGAWWYSLLGGRRVPPGPRVHSLERVAIEGTARAAPPRAALDLAYRPVSFADALGVTAAVAKVVPELNAFLAAAFDGRRLCSSAASDGGGATATTPSGRCASCIFLAYPFNYQIRATAAANGTRARGGGAVRSLPRTMESVFGVRASGDGCAAVEQLQAAVVPLEFIAHATDAALTAWRITGWWFDGRYFGSVAELAASVPRAPADAAPPTGPPPDTGPQFLAPRPGPKRGAAQPLGPLPYEPYGRRFTLSAATSPRVAWLGWEVTIGYKATSGPRFWDVRFKGERILYELSMQEISCGELCGWCANGRGGKNIWGAVRAAIPPTLTHPHPSDFGAMDPVMSDSLFLDSAWGLGAAFRELAHGRDCPLNAAFADTHSFWGGEGAARTHPNSVCVFERDPGAPAAKHYDSLNGYYESVRGGELVVRLAPEGFYEHVVDLVLSVDGTLRVDVTKAGVAPLAPLEHAGRGGGGGFARGYGGPRIALDVFAGADRGGAAGAPLPYVISVAFKADIDIGAARGAGANNSVQLYRLTHARRSAARGFGTGRPSPAVDIHTPEAEVAVPAANLGAVIPVVVAEGETAPRAAPRNPPRGYAIRVHGSASGLPPLLDADEPTEGLPVGAALSFVRWPFVATTLREDEAVGSVPYLNAWYGTPGAARWGLGGYVQPPPSDADACGGSSPPCAGDRLRHSDVVAWVASAGVYVPSLEWEPAFPVGLPVLGFTLAPFNWAAENPATDLTDAVVVKAATPGARGVPGGRGRAVGADEPLHRVAEFVENAAEVCRPRVERVPFLALGFEA